MELSELFGYAKSVHEGLPKFGADAIALSQDAAARDKLPSMARIPPRSGSSPSDRRKVTSDRSRSGRPPSDRPVDRPSQTQLNRERLPLAPQALLSRPLFPEDGRLPVIEVRSPGRHPYLYRKRLGTIDRTAQPGDIVTLVDVAGAPLGYGLFNPRAELAVRVLCGPGDKPDRAWWTRQLQAALDFRTRYVPWNAQTTARRLVHAEGDGLPGLVVDQFGDVLSMEAFAVGMYQRAPAIAEVLGKLAGARHWVLRPGANSLEQEGFVADPLATDDMPEHVTIKEFGTDFEIDLAAGHKTGFFCDQRDNRKTLAARAGGCSLLDVCCYTGGFSLQALKLGGAKSAVGVDLDETAIAVAKRNAKRNQAAATFHQADAFSYLRDLIARNVRFDVVVVDPPKLIRRREEDATGRQKYYDLNRLAMQVAAPGGLMATFSCSGLLDAAEFQRIVAAAAPEGRRATLLERTGAGLDHPIALNCPEGEYLKSMWLRIDG